MKEPGAGQCTPRDDSDGATSLGLEAPAWRVQVNKVLWEGLLVAAMGAAFAFAANTVSPRGLRLTQNYFPGATSGSPLAGSAANLTPRPGAPRVNAPTPAKLLTARLHAKGLQLVESNQVAQLFRDPRYEQELFVFIDARDDRHYEAGHIPGAYQFDHYHAEKYLATVLPACQAAEQVVVYCTGGDCEDSEFAAITLRQTGIPTEKLFVYGGGMTEWATNGLPVEIGGRKSGNLHNPKP